MVKNKKKVSKSQSRRMAVMKKGGAPKFGSAEWRAKYSGKGKKSKKATPKGLIPKGNVPPVLQKGRTPIKVPPMGGMPMKVM